ncbi:TfuA-like protein [Dongia deserti]|uniref:TfuA-like protein n=1 Tax=Dongia deserti TaxID=2268030 RepID=UPI000E65C083|nr:TfuA-like protein [Dongia deserti]
MTIFVFAGPSLARADAGVPGLTYLPPAAEGDIYRAACENPRAIALIDGYFEAQPAVWHKEILWAMSQGIHVFGAASMGALRASELWSFGMVGVGVIYRAYRRGALIDDAEVAVLHGPAELGYPSVTEALANVRANLSRAQARGVLSNTTRRLVLQSAQSIYYKDRTWDRILAEAVGTGMAAEDAAALKSWLRTNSFDLKRRDAGALIRLMKSREAAFDEPLQVSYEFEDTTFWRDLIDRHEPEPEESLRTAV